MRQYCTNCRVYNGFKFQSDHRLLVSEWRTPKTKLARFVKRKKGKPSVKYDLTGFQDEAMKANFQDAVKTKLENTQFDDCSDLESLCSKIVDTLNSAAETTLHHATKHRHRKPIWSTDPHFQQLISERNKLGKQSKCIVSITKIIRKTAKSLKNRHFQQQAVQISALHREGNIRKMYQQAKEQVSTMRKIRVKLDPEKGVQHFKNHFNPTAPTDAQTPPELLNNPPFVENLQNITKNVFINSSAPTVIEVHQFLQQLKTNKASCDVPPEFLKFAAASPQFVALFHHMTSEIWKQRKVPSKFGHGKIEALFKNKGSNKLAKNFRGLNIGSCVGKVVIAMILERLQLWYTVYRTRVN